MESPVKKTIVITMSGEWRYNPRNIDSFVINILNPLKFFELHFVAIFWRKDGIKSEVDKFFTSILPYFKSIHIKFVSTKILKDSNPFDLIIHEDRYKYFVIHKQFSILLSFIKSLDLKPNFILKTRQDLFYLNKLKPPSINNMDDTNRIFIPPVEGHESIPYDPRSVCNDQIAFGSFKVMTKYLSLIKLNKIKICALEKLTLEGFSHRGIEGILREYLLQNRIKVFNLNVLYVIENKKNNAFKFTYHNYIPRFLFDGKPTLLLHLIFRYSNRAWLRLGAH